MNHSTRQTVSVIVALLMLVLVGCQTSQVKQSAHAAPGMIKVSILYPNEQGKTFDMDYYEKKHMPMMAEILGANLKWYEIDKGIAGRTPSDEVPFVAVGYFYCTDLAAYRQAVAQNINTILEDIKKYTTIQPVIQISEIRQAKPGQAK